MIIISETSIEKAFDSLNQLEEKPETVQDFINKFQEKQPALLGYAMTIGTLFEDQDMSEDFLFYTIGLWKSFETETGTPVQKVEEQKLEEIHIQMHEMLETLDEDESMDALPFISKPSQPFLTDLVIGDLSGMAEAIEAENEEEIGKATVMMMNLLIVVEVLHQTLNKNNIILLS
jgi:hypothetical protein